MKKIESEISFKKASSLYISVMLIFISLFMYSGKTSAQNNCIVISDLSAQNIHCTYGDFSNPYANQGVIDFGQFSEKSRHTINNIQTTDPRTGNNLTVIPYGETYSVRLGNWKTKAEAESISYDYYVDTIQGALLILKYAAVMENPNHSPSEQPRFKFEILDVNNNFIDQQCASADFISSASLGWHNYGGILWKDWTNVGVDLSDYHGQTVRIRLTTFDCSQSAHYGYAYFCLNCEKKRITTNSCGEQMSFSAPNGFNYRWYYWDDPNTTISTNQTVTINAEMNRFLCCNCSFFENSNCSFELLVEIQARYPLADFSFQQNRLEFTFTNNSTISSDGITPNGSGDPCESAFWDFGDGSTSNSYNPIHTYSAQGDYIVTLVSGLNQNNCTDTIRTLIHVVCDIVNTITARSCYSYMWEDELFFSSGIYQHIHHYDYNCDSIFYLDLEILKTPYFNIQGDKWVVGGSETQYSIYDYSINLDYPQNIVDSVIWEVDCLNWLFIPSDSIGMTGKLYIYTFITDSVRLCAKTYNSCGVDNDTIWLHTTYFNTGEHQTSDKINVFPNPSDGNVMILLESVKEEINLKIFDSKCILIDELNFRNDLSGETFYYSVPEKTKGLCYFVFNINGAILTKRLVIR